MAEQKVNETVGAEPVIKQGMNLGGQDNNKDGANNQAKTKEPEKVVLTKEEYEAQLQAESDRRVNKALETAQAKWKEDYDKRLEAERKEAEKLARLSEAERTKVLEEKREKELAERERKIYRQELEIAASKILGERKLPVQFAKLFLGENAEETNQNILTFEKEWHKEIEAQVNERLKGVIPKSTQPGDKKLSMNDLIRGQIRR